MKGLLKKIAFCFAAVAFAAGTACSDDKTTVTPEPGPGPGPGPGTDPETEYAIDIKASSALVEYGGELEKNIYGYFIALGDVKLETVDPTATGAGNVVVLEMYSSTGAENMFPAATYQLQNPTDEEVPVPPCFIGETSGYFTTNAAGEAGEPDPFTGGTVTVSGSGASYTLEVIGEFADGRKLRFTYTGALDFVEGGGSTPEVPMLEEDVDTPFVKAVAEYMGIVDEELTGSYILYLYSGAVEGSGSNLYPAELGGYMLQIALYAAAPEEGVKPAIVPGTYTVSSDGAAGTWLNGFINERFYWADGTFLEQRTEESGLCSLGAEGTIDIVLTDENYTVTVDLTSDLGYKIAGTYTGAIQTYDKSYVSNIDSDYTPQLAGLATQAYYYGDYYGVGGNNWLVLIGGFASGTDGMQLDLIVPAEQGFSQGLPAGEYIVGRNYETGTYAAVYGFLNGADLMGTWFLSDFRDEIPYLAAPAKEGSVTIERSGENYTISFDFIDDSPEKHRVSGEWRGKVEIYNDSKGSPAKILHKGGIAKTSASDTIKAAAKAPRHRATKWFANR